LKTEGEKSEKRLIRGKGKSWRKWDDGEVEGLTFGAPKKEGTKIVPQKKNTCRGLKYPRKAKEKEKKIIGKKKKLSSL